MKPLPIIENYLNDININFLKNELGHCQNHYTANLILKEMTGIIDFFEDDKSWSLFLLYLNNGVSDDNSQRREYGDFQTSAELTNKICSFLIKTNFKPRTIIEPTFGKGSFIISSLKHFESIEYIVGVEIYDRYVWETKFRLLEHFLDNPQKIKPDIYLFKQDIFEFDFQYTQNKMPGPVLVLGNPPWITNSELSTLNSTNVPNKSNLKNFKGLDAITGKGNFDIGECISLLMFDNFSTVNGKMVFLIKNSVIKNLVQNLHKFNYTISNIKTYRIDAKKYFNASVGASVFTCDFNQSDNDLTCESYENLSDNTASVKFGWHNNKFSSDVDAYENSETYDGHSPYEWRQGVKHDSAKVFELIKNDNHYLNGLHEHVEIEDDLVYGLIKSSDLKNDVVRDPRKYVIIPQRFIGEETSYLKKRYPKLFAYLSNHENLLNRRKSSIYRNKPKFSIFGIGEYSFKPYKIAISGLYKFPCFSIVLPENDKCLMLDDTCYFLGFDELEPALFTWSILTDKKAHNLLKSISFRDAKRPYTKEILMRIALDQIAIEKKFEKIYDKILKLEIDVQLQISTESWNKYLNSFEKSIELSLV